MNKNKLNNSTFLNNFLMCVSFQSLILLCKRRKIVVLVAQSVKHCAVGVSVPGSIPGQDSHIQRLQFLVKILFIVI